MSVQIPHPNIDWNCKNLQNEMEKFIRQAKLHFSGPLKDISDDVKISYLLICSGDEGQRISDTSVFDNDAPTFATTEFFHNHN